MRPQSKRGGCPIGQAVPHRWRGLDEAAEYAGAQEMPERLCWGEPMVVPWYALSSRARHLAMFAGQFAHIHL